MAVDAGLVGNSLGNRPDILSDAVVERLLRNLEQLQVDYERTVAADRSDQEHFSQDEGQSDEDMGSTRHHDGHLLGYEALVSDDEGEHGEALDCDDQEEATHGARELLAVSNLSVSQSSCDQLATQCAVDLDSERQEEQDSGLWAGSEGFQTALQLESFADFGLSNPVLPEAPPNVPYLQARLLTEEETEVIKDIMKKVNIRPPTWACNLPDKVFCRIVKELVQSSSNDGTL